MIQMVESESPMWHTYHRAWSCCVGLPRYNKESWKMIESAVIHADDTRDPALIKITLMTIEYLLVSQEGLKYF